MQIGFYNIEEHIHRYAVWTAARAASKSRLKNNEIDIIVTTVGLREAVKELQKNITLTEPVYRQWLKMRCEEIIAVVNERNWSDFKTKQFSFGLAAKIIAIYIDFYCIADKRRIVTSTSCTPSN